MTSKIFIVLFIILPALVNAQSWQSRLLNISETGELTYHSDDDGFIIPDFSHAGYMGGGVALPDVSVVLIIKSVSGDNTLNIQNAIEQVGKMPLNKQGIRGALLLKAGLYRVSGTLRIPYDGVVLRGEGNDSDLLSSTIIYATGNIPNQRDVILVGNENSNNWIRDSCHTQPIVTPIVMPHQNAFEVANACDYKVGDVLCITHYCTSAWLKAVNYGDVPDPAEQWGSISVPPRQLTIYLHRYVTSVCGNVITVDAPVFYTLNRSLSQCTVHQFKSDGRFAIRQNIGLENLRVDVESQGGIDETHAWQCIRLKSVENCWVKGVVAKGFGQSGIVTECCTRTTITHCESIDPVSIIDGKRRCNFQLSFRSQLILFDSCYARNGRHHYISNGTASVSGIVFSYCTSDASYSQTEGHRQFTQGLLFDCHRDINVRLPIVLGLYNRGDYGTGHGWGAVQSYLWNCDFTPLAGIYLQKPPTAQNYTIGCIASEVVCNKPFPRTIGYVEGLNQAGLIPASLYQAQLNARLKK